MRRKIIISGLEYLQRTHKIWILPVYIPFAIGWAMYSSIMPLKGQIFPKVVQDARWY